MKKKKERNTDNPVPHSVFAQTFTCDKTCSS